MHRYRSTLALAALGSVAISGCIQTGVNKLKGTNGQYQSIEVDPVHLSFGGLAPGETATDIFTVRSVGTQALTVESIRIQGSPAFTLTTDLEDSMMEPGDERDVIVTYTPTNVSDEATAIVTSDDQAAHEVLVRLDGTGLWPALSIEPSLVDFGLHDVDDVAVADVALVNVGGAPLELYTGVVIGEGYSMGPFVPTTLSPGEETSVEVTFNPLYNASFPGELWVSSNDPSETDKADLRGTTLEAPVAVCSVSPGEAFALYDTVTWIGRDSYDPSGLDIADYEWGLITRPTGSSVSMPSGTADRTPFVADVIGTYTAQLVVTNSEGTSSEPCIATLEATPAQDLWIEMYWVHSGDDMDLHLVRSTDSPNSNTGDCYFANCVGRGLDWGVQGDNSDDPSLDIDDIGGVGPENINIFSPSESTYEVYLHDYPGSVYSSANDTTINVYMLGDLVWSETRTITGEDSMTHYATIDWDDRTVISR
jgi:hypothetical protein